MRRISLLAAAGLVALGLTTPAQAAGPDYTLSGTTEVGLSPYSGTSAPKASTADIRVTNPTEKDYEGAYTVTFDLSALKGVADVSVKEEGSRDCERTGDRLVCRDDRLYAGLQSVVALKLTAAKGSKLGDHGAIKATGQAAGITFTSFSTEVTVGGPDLVMQRLKLKSAMKVGDKQATPVAFVNDGTRPANGVVLELMTTRGLEFVEKYDNCTFRPEGPQEQGRGTTVCTFEGSFEPGYVYQLDQPLNLRATNRAWYDSFIYRIHETPAGATPLKAPGNGAKLGLKQAASKFSGDLNPWDNQQEFDFRTANTADFTATPVSLKAAAGQTVRASFGFRNHGPAWIANLRSGEPAATVDVKIPTGARVTRKPEECSALNADYSRHEQELGAPLYRCGTGYVVDENEAVAFPFELKVDKVVSDAAGSVTAGSWQGQRALGKLPFDPNHANNTAVFVLNPSGTGPTANPTPSATPTPTATATGSASPSASASPSGSATPSASATPGGQLGDTGSNAGLLAAGAAATVAGGAAIFFAARRRPGQRH